MVVISCCISSEDSLAQSGRSKSMSTKDRTVETDVITDSTLLKCAWLSSTFTRMASSTEILSSTISC